MLMNGAKSKTRSYVSRFFLSLAVLALVAFGLGLAFGAGATYAQSAPNPLSDTDWLLKGEAEYSASGSVVLTPAAGYQLGFLIHPHPVSTQRLNVEFSFEIEGGSGADGLALVLSRNLLDDPITGSGGSGGCGGCFASPQFVDGIAVEIDTYPNSWDISGNHLGISLLGGSSPVDLAAVNVEHELRNNGVFNAEVTFDNGRVRVYLSNPDLRMERTLLLDHTIPDFTPFQRYLGFVGTTGGATDRHIIHQVNLEGTDATPPLTPAPTATPAPEPEAASFARKPSEDFSALGINDPEGIWSDGKTMWVSSPALDRILAFNMTTKARDEGKDITNLASGNGDPQALWSDGNTMWVGDGSYPNSDRLYGRIFAYKMDINDDGSAGPDHGSRDPGKEIVSARGAISRGIWSDGATAWVTQHRTDVFSDIRAYLMDLDQDGRRGEQHGDGAPDKDYTGVTGEGLWSDGTTLWVAKGGDEQIHAYDLAAKSRVAGKDFQSVGGVAQGIWSDGKTMWVAIGHQIHAFEMPPFSINEAAPALDTPTSAATTASEPEAAPFAHKPWEDFDNLKLPATHGSAEGMWSDGTTIWLVETTEDRLYAFNMSTKLREGTKYFNTLAAADNTSPESNWSDGTTMWVAETDRIFAYSMSTKKRVPSEDFDTLRPAGNVGVEGIWSDGVTLWTADHDHDKLFAYNLDTKERVPDEDFNTLDDAGNNWPIAIWSNGATMWVSDWTDDKLYAYDMDSKQRVDDLDFNTLDAASNNTPEGIWANRETMWVRDSEDNKLYAYQMPAGPGPPPATPSALAAAEIDDQRALAVLYLNTGGLKEDWTWLDEEKKWEPDKPLSEWEGVTVNGEGRVTELRLRGKGLEGAIPPLLGSLTELQVLDLSNNQLGGVLPVELADLDKLRTLNSSGNNLRGEMPSELGNLTALETLDLSSNNLSGPIPPQLSHLENLEYLDLSRNQLTGVIPEELAELKQLRRDGLRLYGHEFSGCVPSELKGRLAESYFAPRLVQQNDIVADILDLASVYLPGEIQSFLSQLLNQKDLAEAIQEIKPGSSLKDILAPNSVTAKRIAKDIRGFSSIFDVLDLLSQDWFIRWVRGAAEATYGLGAPPCPPVPPAPATTLDRQSLDSDRTALLAIRQYYLNYEKDQYDDGGENEYTFTKNYNRAQRLAGKRSFNWPEQGHVSKWHGVTVENGRVVGLEITDRLLEGGIPAQVGDLGALKRLNLSRNRLSGPIPKALGNLVNLGHLSLNGKSDLCGRNYNRTGNCGADRLSGEIPRELGNLTKLKVLHLHENNFEGQIPLELGNAVSLAPNKENLDQGDPKLREVNFRSSGLTGCLPPKLQGNFDTPIGARFVAYIARIVAFTAVGTANPLVGATLSLVDYVAGGKITSLVDWANNTTATFITRQGTFHSDLGDVTIYCDPIPDPVVEPSSASRKRSEW